MTTNKKLLLVEDDKELRETLEDILFINDIDFHLAENAEAAKYLVKQNKLPYHLVLSDYLMPGESGLDFFEYLNTLMRYKNIPFYIITARTENDIRHKCLSAGVTDFIEKPFEMNLFIKIIRKHFS
jgi:DNA-binding response OmpR family regulator